MSFSTRNWSATLARAQTYTDIIPTVELNSNLLHIHDSIIVSTFKTNRTYPNSYIKYKYYHEIIKYYIRIMTQWLICTLPKQEKLLSSPIHQHKKKKHVFVHFIGSYNTKQGTYGKELER